MKLLSVNVGRPRTNHWQSIAVTGIDKRPVGGPVMVAAPVSEDAGEVGLAGDRVYVTRTMSTTISYTAELRKKAHYTLRAGTVHKV